jgi:hypothetical protein
VFAFLLAVTEVNVMLASVHFAGYGKTSMLNFRKLLSLELMNNPYIPKEDDGGPRRSPRNETARTHSLRTLPRSKKFLGSEIVHSNMLYPQAKCRGCKKKVRTYCVCSPGVVRCDDCFAQHVFDAETACDKPVLNSVSGKTTQTTPAQQLFSP